LETAIKKELSMTFCSLTHESDPCDKL